MDIPLSLGITCQVYRNCDSTWALATAEELAAGLDWWQSILNSGEADTYLKDREAVRAVVGQTTVRIRPLRPGQCECGVLT